MRSFLSTFAKLSLNIKNSYLHKKYRRCLKVAFSNKYLLYTNVTISITLSSFGDVLEQHYEIYTNELEKWDRVRTIHMAFSGFGVGIICHNWYKVLDRVLVGRSLTTIIKKLFLDQTICSPLMIMAFFASVAIFEDSPLEEFKSEIKDKFWTLYKAEWVVWPPAQIFNFYFLPTRYRVLYDNTISLGYDVYTSHVKHSKKDKEKAVNSTKSLNC